MASLVRSHASTGLARSGVPPLLARAAHLLGTPSALPLVLVLCLALAVCVAAVALFALKEVLIHERGAELAHSAAGIAQTIDRILFERAGDIQVFAQTRALREGRREESLERLQTYAKVYGYYSHLVLTDAQGRVIGASEASEGPDYSQAPWFQTLKQTREIQLLDPQRFPRGSEEIEVGFAAPVVSPEGRFIGSVVSFMPVAKLRPILEREGRLRYGEEAFYDWVLLDRRGVVIQEASPHRLLRANLVQQGVPSALAARQSSPGFLEEVHRERGEAVLTGYARTRGYADFLGFDWSVLLRLERARAYAPVEHIVWKAGAVALLVIAPLTAFGAWSASRLLRESRRLLAAQQELEATVTDLQRSNQDLQQFAYVASHDLQEPLRMVASYTQLLAKRYRGRLDTDADEFIRFAVDGANRMQRLINDLLAYSRVDRQKQRFAMVSAEQALEQAIQNLKLAIEEAKAKITHGPLPVVLADQQELVQIFQNLLSNAIKFRSHRPVEVHVSARHDPGRWHFVVQDNGIGIEPQYDERIFVIFQRLHTAAEYPGTGIGLAICKKIVERHGGRIWVESQPGKGSSFHFTVATGG